MHNRTIVVSALISNGHGEVLMAKRPKDKVFANQWELPGGKVEFRESERGALMREVREELGVECYVGGLISTASFVWGDVDAVPVHMLLYHCITLTSPMRPLASQKLVWQCPIRTSSNLACCPSLYTWLPDIRLFLENESLEKWLTAEQEPGWDKHHVIDNGT